MGLNNTKLAKKPSAVIGGPDLAYVVTNNAHTCALSTNGTASCWGYNWWGFLGTGRYDGRSHMVPEPVASNGDTYRSIFPGSINTFAIRNDGTLWAWVRSA